MIAIIDYGVGNMFSLCSSLKFLNMKAIVTNSAEDMHVADEIILPGVGAFGDAMKKLQATGLADVIIAEAKKGKPILGICLGMQMLFETSHEYGAHQGLALIKGAICPLEKDIPGYAKLKIPHIGWNSLKKREEDPIFRYSANEGYVYYVHSYYAKGCLDSTLAYSDYGVKIPGIVKRGNVYGMQFHPEKSGEMGLSLLKGFGDLG